MKKAFTLVELIAVITILALITVLGITFLLNNVNNSEIKISESMEKVIFTANELNMSDEKQYPIKNGNVYCTQIKTLIDNNLLDEELKDPLTNEYIDELIYIKTEIKENLYINSLQNECTEIRSYIDLTLNGAEPELVTGMIAVDILEDKKVVTVDLNSKWYDYANKDWANVVLVTDATRSKYQNSSPGTEVLKQDILAYYVWVPRYEYQNELDISSQQINFVNKYSTKNTSNVLGEWNTPTAFTLNNQEVNGFWTAKYDISSTQVDNTEVKGTDSFNCTTTDCDFINTMRIIENDNPVINREDTNINTAINNMNNSTNSFGLSNDSQSLLLTDQLEAIKILTNTVYASNESIITTEIPFARTKESNTDNVSGIYDLNLTNFLDKSEIIYNSDNDKINSFDFMNNNLVLEEELPVSGVTILGGNYYPPNANKLGLVNGVFYQSISGQVMAISTDGSDITHRIIDSSSLSLFCIVGSVDAITGEYTILYSCEEKDILYLSYNNPQVLELKILVQNVFGNEDRISMLFEIHGAYNQTVRNVIYAN